MENVMEHEMETREYVGIRGCIVPLKNQIPIYTIFYLLKGDYILCT